MDCYPDGTLRDCVVSKPHQLVTSVGNLVPLFEDNEIRRKTGKPITFYPNGQVKNLPLQDQTGIPTSLGTVPAEHVTFYEDGSLHRLFPRDGKLSGYWTEEDERDLAYELELALAGGRFKSRVIGIQFYSGGAVKSITLWPGEMVLVNSPLGPLEVRTGISFYPEGQLKSLEPAHPIPVQTPIGIICAYDSQALGLNGDVNSLGFSATGELVSLTTSTDEVELTGQTGAKYLFKPGYQPNLLDPEVLDPVPLKMEFTGNKILFDQEGKQEFNITDYTFTVKSLKLPTGCSGCTNCAGCDG